MTPKLRIAVINTHSGHNPLFLEGLLTHLATLQVHPTIIGGYDGDSPLEHHPERIILTGVPLDANYSLSEPRTQALVEKIFSWLKQVNCPVLGICYGHQIIAQIFGGRVATLNKPVLDGQHTLELIQGGEMGIFEGFERLEVFAEHRDYLSKVPPGFKVLTQASPLPYIIYNPEKQIYGIQFVPELSDKGTQRILKRFVTGWKES